MSKDKPESLAIDGEGISVGIIAARYNFQLVNALVESVTQTLSASGVSVDDIETFRVPGSNEIPHAAAMAAKTGEFDVIIGLGLIIEGDTNVAGIDWLVSSWIMAGILTVSTVTVPSSVGVTSTV